MKNNHVGETVGIFNIVELMPYKDADRHSLYRGICKDCGFERIARYHDLNRSKKCNHIRIDGEIAFHPAEWSNSRLRDIFHSMKQRCYNKNNKDYVRYGAKGIKICKEWMDDPKSFEEWSFQNGYNDLLTIDRKNSKSDYCPENCRWVTKQFNSKYKSTTTLIDVDGDIHSGKDWSKILGFGANVINTYIKKYGYDNTVEFIRRYIADPNLKSNNNGKSFYSLYMN